MLGFLLSPVLQIEDIDGKPLVGGKVFVYEANTSILATVYKDYNGTFNTNPVILDTAGHNTIIAENDKLYDITVKDSNDNLLFSVEDVAVGSEGGSAIVTDITVQAGNNGIAVGQSVVSGVKTFKVSADYNFLASKSDLANKQDKLSAGPNIDITNNVVSGKDWQSEIDAAVDAVATGFIPYSATNIPAGSSVSVFGDSMLLVGKNITGIAYGNLAVGENIYKTAPNGLIAGSGINGSQNDILVGNGVSAGNNDLVLGDSISSLGNSIIIGGPSITGKYGESTIVVGNNNLTGMGNHNVVLGHANTATSGTDNVIIGRGNSTTGSENIVIGIDNSSNSGTIFGGIYNQVNNFGYIYGGSYNTATNAAAVLNGDGCYASGTGSVAEGLETSALGDDSHAEGHDTIASGNYSHAGGYGTTALGENQTVFGRYNSPNTGDIFQIGCGTFGSGKNAFVVSPSSLITSSDNTYTLDSFGTVIDTPNTITASNNFVDVKVRTQLQPVDTNSISTNPENYITEENTSITKNIVLPKFYINKITTDSTWNTKVETYETYYNLDENASTHVSLAGDIYKAASPVESQNTINLFDNVYSYIAMPYDGYTIIPENENGLFKLEGHLHIKGGYDYNSSNNNVVRNSTISLKCKGYAGQIPQFGGLYKGFPTTGSTPVNYYHFVTYFSRTKNDPTNGKRIALTGIDFHVPYKRWNVSETTAQKFTLDFTRMKIREYEGQTYVSNSAADFSQELG